MAIVTENGTIPERYDVETVDNRDQGATWLWIGDDYIEVNPVELMGNMIENCYNDDLLFLFHQFADYLDNQDIETIKDDTDTDHFVGFTCHVACTIAESNEDTGR